ncbi:Uncharacterised protein [Yersinia enterocolitica]|nr:Uncharacterised protein [Yersinia enterocolitica]
MNTCNTKITKPDITINNHCHIGLLININTVSNYFVNTSDDEELTVNFSAGTVITRITGVTDTNNSVVTGTISIRFRLQC